MNRWLRRLPSIERMLVYANYSTAEMMGTLGLLWVTVIFWIPGAFDGLPNYSLLRLLHPHVWAFVTAAAVVMSVASAVAAALDIRLKHWLRAVALLAQTFIFSWVSAVLWEGNFPWSFSVGLLAIFALGAARAMLVVAVSIAAELAENRRAKRTPPCP